MDMRVRAMRTKLTLILGRGVFKSLDWEDEFCMQLIQRD